jgi:uncharacterized OB-fold protein
MANDLFDNKILCNECNKEMKKVLISKNGFNLRAAKCEKCGETIIHPQDKIEYENFVRLKQKEYDVKMRMVGNSYTVSIPREIVDFMQEQEEKMNSMVRLCFEDFGKISMRFNPEDENEIKTNENHKSRIVKAKEVQVIKNGKPVYHARQFFDSKHPENNHTRIFKSKNAENQESEENDN